MNQSTSGRAAQYVRMSTDKQEYSLENQRDAISIYAALRGLEVVETFKDEGKSGLTIDGRPGLQSLIRVVESGAANFDVILVYDVSRWGRFQDVDEAAYYEHRCKRQGVHIEYCAEPFQNDGSPLTAIIKGLKRAMAGEYSRELSSKVFAGQHRLATSGYNLGGMSIYGYRRQIQDSTGSTKLILKPGERKNVREHRTSLVLGPPEEAETVRWIFQQFLAGAERVQIAKELAKRGRRSDNGKAFTAKFVGAVLTNERYTGTSVWNRTSARLKSPRVPNSEERWVRIENALPAIVDKATFLAAQGEIRRRATRLTDEEMLEPLRNLLKKHGYISIKLINSTPGVMAHTGYVFRFGSMLRVYELVGYKIPIDFTFAAIRRRLEEMRPAVFAAAANKFTTAGHNVEVISKRRLRIDGREIVTVCMSRYMKTRDRAAGWYGIVARAQRSDFFVLVRTDKAHTQILDYYLYPAKVLAGRLFRTLEKDIEQSSPYACADLDAIVSKFTNLRGSFSEQAPAI